MAYSELAAEIHRVDLEPQSPQLAHMLDEILTGRARGGTRDAERRGGAQGRRPDAGVGFFELAQTLGHDTRDRVAFGVGELAKVHGTWA